MEIKECPACGKPMNYNLEGLKKNAKAPTWKCSDKGCKFQLNFETKQYEPSEFVTGVWEKDEAKGKPSNNSNRVAEAKFTSELDKDLEDKKWDKIRGEKNDNIKWNMVLKLAVEAWIAGKVEKDQISIVANWLYSLAPKEEV